MAKKRMSWDNVGGQKVFVFTTFLDHNVFKVEVMRGEDVTPRSMPWFEYIETGIASKEGVVSAALKRAGRKISEGDKCES